MIANSGDVPMLFKEEFTPLIMLTFDNSLTDEHVKIAW